MTKQKRDKMSCMSCGGQEYTYRYSTFCRQAKKQWNWLYEWPEVNKKFLLPIEDMGEVVWLSSRLGRKLKKSLGIEQGHMGGLLPESLGMEHGRPAKQ